ncbi:MAG: hypothetical protein CMM50_08455 [Rhodospirillaceae bacterium]|nr:hypothetical protein [Rhodospirillaceae bacterium]
MSRTSFAAFLVLFLAAGPLAAQEVSVHDVWAKATPEGAPMGAAFLTVDNLGGDDLLRSATSDVAEAVELHSHVMEDSVMRMRQIEGVPIPAGSTVAFKPGGLHIMLIGLHSALQAGSSFPMTLIFDKAGPVTVNVTVKAPTAGAHSN